jgi:DNA polymerase III subunit epsilon
MSYLVLDCQTTGVNPQAGQILEIAWCFSGRPDSMKSFLLKVPELSKQTLRLTGITLEEMKSAVAPEVAFEALKSDLKSNPVLLIHYARFEKAFLDSFFSLFGEKFTSRIICTCEVAKKVLPRLPSRSLRGLAGYFGYSKHETKRAGSHVEATLAIWNGLVKLMGSDSLETVDQWLASEKPREKSFQYPLQKSKRLILPDRPGVYKFLSHAGDVLYVGKATSLNDRVNSYFRGRKGRDSRKLEMLTQAYDVEVRVCNSILEASLVENDLIKTMQPPYNLALKSSNKLLVFYSRDFESVSRIKFDERLLGPFTAGNSIDQLILLSEGAETGVISPEIFYEAYEPELLKAGFALFCEKHERLSNFSIREMLAYGLCLLREGYQDKSPKTSDIHETENKENSVELSPEEIMAKFERLFVRAAQSYLRSRLINRLMNSQVVWSEKSRETVLSFQRGRLVDSPELADWNVMTYDRLSILCSEIEKLRSKNHKVAIHRQSYS